MKQAQDDTPTTTDRKRARRDAARILPGVGMVLVCLPLLWRTGDGAWRMSSVLIYVLVLWIVLIAAALLISRTLGHDAGENQ